MGSIVKTIGPASTLPVEGFENYLSETMISVPYTAIKNRAKIINLAQDAGVRIGVNRIMTQKIIKLQNEFGPNGEPVYRIAGDQFDQIRCVGTRWNDFNSIYGTHLQMNTSGDQPDYVEITFYGTGLNMLCLPDQNRSYVMSVDGGPETNFNSGISSTTVLAPRIYTANILINVVSGLSLGIHTIKIRQNSGPNFPLYGFETLNESTQLNINAGKAYINGDVVSIQPTLTDYNSGFTNEYGVAGTKGGHVLVYADSNGVVHKDIQWTNSTQQNLLAADHTNEEVIRTINFRQFSSGRQDDFGVAQSSIANRAFTLSDGTTTLIGDNVTVGSGNTPDTGEYLSGNTAAMTLTFVGTGLDLNMVTGAGLPLENIDISVNGISVGSYGGGHIDSIFTKPIVSGLPYGTHTVKIVRASTGNFLGIREFVIYGPKKPELPNNCIELASYNLMANFVANTTAGALYRSQGVLRKILSKREASCTGSWNFAGSAPGVTFSGSEIYTGVSGAYVEYTFFGTGFDYRAYADTNRDTAIQVSLNGLTANLTNYPTITTSNAGGFLFNTTTGTVNMNSVATPGSSFTIQNLPLGVYTVKLQTTSANILSVDAFDVITPIHSVKYNKQVIQNALEVGSQSISDNRNFKNLINKNLANYSIVNGLTDTGTTSTVLRPIEDMIVSIKLDKPTSVEVYAEISAENSTASQFMITAMSINGVLDTMIAQNNNSTGGWEQTARYNKIFDLGAGDHFFQLFYASSSGALISNADGNDGHSRYMSIKELK